MPGWAYCGQLVADRRDLHTAHWPCAAPVLSADHYQNLSANQSASWTTTDQSQVRKQCVIVHPYSSWAELAAAPVLILSTQVVVVTTLVSPLRTGNNQCLVVVRMCGGVTHGDSCDHCTVGPMPCQSHVLPMSTPCTMLLNWKWNWWRREGCRVQKFCAWSTITMVSTKRKS